MNPSSFDDRTSAGLCGMVGNPTLYSADGKDVSKNYKEFVTSWKYVKIYNPV